MYTKDENNGRFWNTFLEIYQDRIEHQADISKKLIGSLTEAYNKHVEFSLDNFKKTQEEICRQLNYLADFNQKFWPGSHNNNAPRTANEENKNANNVNDPKRQYAKATV